MSIHFDTLELISVSVIPVTIILVSSAQLNTLYSKQSNLVGRSFTQVRNRRGPKKLPWGTPKLTFFTGKLCISLFLLTTTRCFPLPRYESIHLRVQGYQSLVCPRSVIRCFCTSSFEKSMLLQQSTSITSNSYHGIWTSSNS